MAVKTEFGVGTKRVYWPAARELTVPILAFFGYSVVAFARFNWFRSSMDLGIFGQAVKAYSNFGTPYVPIKAQAPFNILGDHFSPIIATIAPVYHLVPQIQVLLIVQAALFSWAVYLVGLTAKEKLGEPYGVIFGVCFALSWAVFSAVIFDFHKVAFVVPFLILAVRAAEKSQWRHLVLWCLLLLLTKEDTTFLIAGIALMLLAMRRLPAGLILGTSSIVAFFLLVRWIIPYFSYYGRYTYFAVVSPTNGFGVLRNIYNSDGRPFWTLFCLILVTCGPGLRSPLALVVLPTLASRLFSDNPAYWQLNLHYQAPLIAVCFLALIDGWSKYLRYHTSSRSRIFVLVYLVLLATQSCNIILNFSNLPQPNAKAKQFDTVCRSIPHGATVIADAYVLSHLVDRDTVYLANRSWTDSTGKAFDPRIGWVLLDETSPADGNPAKPWVKAREIELISQGYSVTSRAGPIVLLHRT